MFKFKTISKEDIDKINAITEPARGNNLSAAGGGAPTDLVMPHDTYTVGLSELKNAGSPIAKSSGKRVIGASADNFNQIYDLHDSAGGGSPEPQLLKDQEFIKDYESAFGNILGTALERENFEVRLLKIPALHVEALWLHKEAGNDVYIPVRSIKLLEKNKKYDKATFFNILKEAAKNYDMDDPKLGG